jgi:type II secretory pathway pseudopilin PulG
LIELLIAIAIVVILIAIVITVGFGATTSNKERVTRDVLSILDNAVTEYIAIHGQPPPPTMEWPGRTPTPRYIVPVSDVVDMGTGQPLDSVALFLLQMRDETRVRGVLEGVPAKFVRAGTPPTGLQINESLVLNTVVDGWGRPIRYVHPKLAGLVYGPSWASPTNPSAGLTLQEIFSTPPAGTVYPNLVIRRNATDADSGRADSARPYFYSAGSDGNPSTTDDNVYTIRPLFVK